MIGEATRMLNARLAESPRQNVLFLLGPLILVAAWFAGVRPPPDTNGIVITSCLILIAGVVALSWGKRWLALQIICWLSILVAAALLLIQIGAEDRALLASLKTNTSLEAICLIYLGTAALLAKRRSTSVVHAALAVYIPMQLIQYSAINLYSLVGGVEHAGAYTNISPFSAALHFATALVLLMQVMLSATASRAQAAVWPQAAVIAALTSLLVSLYLHTAFSAVISALSGALLIGIAFLGCSAAITRRDMFRLHLRLQRKVRSQHKQQEALIAARADYEELYEQVPIGVMKTAETGRILSVNSRMCEVLGFATVEQLTSTDLRALFVDPERRKRDFLAWKTSGDREWAGNVEMLKSDGTPIIAHFTGCRVNDSHGNLRYVLSCYQDVTERRKAEREIKKLESDLRLTHKLEAVGRLAAGVAHEINTPMQYIGDNVFFLSSAYDDLRALTRGLTEQLRKVAADAGMSVDDVIRELEEEADLEYLDEAVGGSFKRTLDGVNSVAEIVRSMKEFAYPNDKQASYNDVNALLANTLTVSRSMYVAAAEITTEFAELPPTLCFPGELNQVFVNIVVNAAHAIEKANQTLNRAIGEIRIVTSLIENNIVVKIIDNGTGMPAAVRERIFDPFFTTKEVGKGTGQGLAIAHSIIAEKHGGSITVSSEAGIGTTFTISIPLRTPETEQ